MKLWRPRFSLRTLLVLITLTCIYFAAWEVTKRRGVLDVESKILFRGDLMSWTTVDFRSPMPFVVGMTSIDSRRHFIWLFGRSWETPIRWKIEHSSSAAKALWWGIHSIEDAENFLQP